MGLDSLELLVEIEKYFSIEIPDHKAEKIYTIQNMVDEVAARLNVTSEDTPLRDELFEKIKIGIQHVKNNDTRISLTNKLTQVFPLLNDRQTWSELEHATNLKIPRPKMVVNTGSKFKTFFNWIPEYDAREITVDKFVDAVCMRNYEFVVDKNHINTKYEIYIVVSGITANKIGVDYFEISPGKSFVDDLGVD